MGFLKYSVKRTANYFGYEIKKIGDVRTISGFYRAPLQAIETEPNPDVLRAMFNRVQEQWRALGETEPHWSVLSHERFKSKNIAKTEDEFYLSGKDTTDLIDEFFARAGLPVPRGTCVELGCGVGRATRYLADKFSRVLAVDISKGNLALAARHLSRCKVNNVDLIQINAIHDFDTLPSFDFIFSTIVLQHNPPPIQKAVIDKLLEKLNLGGSCLFQIPTELPNYGFDATKYLSSAAPLIEMHSLPMKEVLSLLQKHKLQILEVRPDNWTGTETGSFTFFACAKTI